LELSSFSAIELGKYLDVERRDLELVWEKTEKRLTKRKGIIIALNEKGDTS